MANKTNIQHTTYDVTVSPADFDQNIESIIQWLLDQDGGSLALTLETKTALTDCTIWGPSYHTEVNRWSYPDTSVADLAVSGLFNKWANAFGRFRFGGGCDQLTVTFTFENPDTATLFKLTFGGAA